jgi:D-alanyl-D-alanine carboxypeptidase/D-alanyl-D-alanine-endopeptidase (penicillin-binding protein 4)
MSIVVSLGNYADAVTTDYQSLFKSSIASRRLSLKKFGVSVSKKQEGGKWVSVFEHNSDQLFTPASITKSLTTAGLLEQHGMHYKIPTTILTKSKPLNKKIIGDVYIKGAGDPTLVSEKMWLLVNEIKKWGVEQIVGDLIFDDSAFDQNYLDGDRSTWNQRAYNSALSGLAVNWNSVRVRFLDGPSLNVTVDPKNPYFEIRAKKHFKKSSQVDIKDYKKKEVLSVFFGKDALDEEKSIYRRVFNPRQYFSSQFVEMLKKEKINFTGKVKWGEAPQGLTEIGKIESLPMAGMIKLMMKFSNNFIADMLTKHTAFEVSGKSGTYLQGLDLLQQQFSTVHRFSNGVVYKSASGLSRDNKISTKDFNNFMLNLQNKVYYPEFMAALPIACTDGTLKKRLCDLKGLVRAKTGLLAGVAALSGYYKKPGGTEEYVFTMVYNGSNGQQFDAKQTFDQFLSKL